MNPKTRLLSIGLAAALATAVTARWSLPSLVDVPIDQLIRNLERQTQKSPKDAALHYHLGRIYSLAFVTQKEAVGIVSGSDQPGSVPDAEPYQWIYSPLPPSTPMTQRRVIQLQQTIKEYRLATQLDPKNGLYAMGLGWALETASTNATKIFNRLPEGVARDAIAAYRDAIRLSLEEDKHRLERLPFSSVEASEGVIRLVKAYPKLNAPGLIAEMKENIRKVKSSPHPVTPIIVPLQGETSLAELLDPKLRTHFDLDARSEGRSWPWVRPSTGILVWDPMRTGRITSGRQLFGSVTWWMFFENGYRALASLDTDNDGWLTAAELRGIRLWIDANGDGKSEPREMRDLADLGIEGIATREEAQSPEGPSTTKGIRWKDGRVTPTYDWVAKP